MRLTTLQAIGLAGVGLVGLGVVFAIVLPQVYPTAFSDGGAGVRLALVGWILLGAGILGAWIWVQNSNIAGAARERRRLGPSPPPFRGEGGASVPDFGTPNKRGSARLLKTAAFAAFLFIVEAGLLAEAASLRGTPPMPFDWVGFTLVAIGIGLGDVFLIYYFSTWVSPA